MTFDLSSDLVYNLGACTFYGRTERTYFFVSNELRIEITHRFSVGRNHLPKSFATEHPLKTNFYREFATLIRSETGESRLVHERQRLSFRKFVETDRKMIVFG